MLWVVGPCRYSAFLSGLVYPCVVHWTWSNDAWLADGSGPRGGGEGYKDFAGSGVVHITGGTAALIGALAVGPRSAVKSMSYTHKRLMMAHSIPLVSLGTTILIFGFIGFNGGSVERMDSIEDACKMSLAVVNTMLAAATGSIMMTFSFKLVFRHWNFGSTCNGAIAGMVAIAAGAGEYRPWCGAVVGAIGGVVAFVWSLVLHHIGVDDAIDAISVHLGAGIWGVIAAPLFNQVDSIFYDDSQSSWTTLAWNVAGALVIMTWTSCNMILFFGMLRFFDQLRIISDVHGDTREIDELTHQEKAYVFDGVNEKVPMVHVNDDGNMNDQGQDGDQDQDQDGEQGTLEIDNQPAVASRGWNDRSMLSAVRIDSPIGETVSGWCVGFARSRISLSVGLSVSLSRALSLCLSVFLCLSLGLSASLSFYVSVCVCVSLLYVSLSRALCVSLLYVSLSRARALSSRRGEGGTHTFMFHV